MTKTYAEYVAEDRKRKPSIHLAPPTAQLPTSARPKKRKFEQPPLDTSYWGNKQMKLKAKRNG